MTHTAVTVAALPLYSQFTMRWHHRDVCSRATLTFSDKAGTLSCLLTVCTYLCRF